MNRRGWGGHRSKLMIGVIARQTILEHLLSFRFFAGCALAFGLIATPTWVRLSQFNRPLALSHIARHQAQRAQARAPVASSLALKLVRPPEVLSIFVQGHLPPARSGRGKSVKDTALDPGPRRFAAAYRGREMDRCSRGSIGAPRGSRHDLAPLGGEILCSPPLFH